MIAVLRSSLSALGKSLLGDDIVKAFVSNEKEEARLFAAVQSQSLRGEGAEWEKWEKITRGKIDRIAMERENSGRSQQKLWGVP